MTETKSDLNLRVTEDGMAVLLDCEVPEKGLSMLAMRIENELEALGIADAPDHDELEKLLRRDAESGPDLVNEVLAEGQPPVPSRDGKIEWAGDFFSKEFIADEQTGAIDYRRRVGNPSVKEGQLLARMTRAKDGQDGRDVFGKVVPVEKAKRIQITKGSNVRLEEEEDALCYYATADGRARWTGGGLAVDKVYSISGGVGLETGHISHPGALVIGGDVQAGSEIEAGGDIEVKGTIEAADIRTTGSLTVYGGITGAEGRTIRAAGGIRARYIRDADIEAGGDVVVEREILLSTVKTTGAVSIPQGRVVGGEVMALGGIVVGQAGSDGLVPTTLIAAEDYSLGERLNPQEEEIRQLEKNLEKIHATVDPLLPRKNRLPPKKQEAIAMLLFKADEVKQAIDKHHAEVEELKAASAERAKPQIVINKNLFASTVLRIKRTKLHVTDSFCGPLLAAIVSGDVEIQQTSTRA